MNKNSEIRKEEILAKSRESMQDEGVEYAENKGSRLADYSVGILGALITAFALFNGELAAAWASMLLVSAYGFGIFFSLYRFTKRKDYLFITAWSVLVIVAFLLLFLASVYGWTL